MSYCTVARRDRLSLNVKKYYTLTFSRSTNVELSQYFLDKSCFESVNCFGNLGVVLDGNLKHSRKSSCKFWSPRVVILDPYRPFVCLLILLSYYLISFLCWWCCEAWNCSTEFFQSASLKWIWELYLTLVIKALCIPFLRLTRYEIYIYGVR